jgi:hypothetical protein
MGGVGGGGGGGELVDLFSGGTGLDGGVACWRMEGAECATTGGGGLAGGDGGSGTGTVGPGRGDGPGGTCREGVGASTRGGSRPDEARTTGSGTFGTGGSFIGLLGSTGPVPKDRPFLVVSMRMAAMAIATQKPTKVPQNPIPGTTVKAPVLRVSSRACCTANMALTSC